MNLPGLDLASVLDASPNAYLLLDRDCVIRGANRSYLSAVRRELCEIVGRPAWEAFPSDPETLEKTAASLERAVRTKQPSTLPAERYDMPGPDGALEERWWCLSHRPVLDVAGEVTYVLQHTTDVTVEQKRRARLEAAERTADAYFENSTDGIFFTSVLPDGGFSIQEVNPAYEAVLGLTARGRLGLRLEEQIGPDLAARARPHYQQAVETGLAQTYRTALEHAGRRLELEMLLVPVRDEAGQITRIVGSARDITAHLQAEESRRDADALYRAYFQNSTEALFVIAVLPDGGFSIQEVNPAHEAFVGFEKAGTLGLRLEEQLPADLVPQIAANYRRVLETGSIHRYLEAILFGGRRLHIETVLVPVRDDDGRIARIVGSSRDMTAQVEAEQRLRESQKLESMGQLTGGVAHDFNNLLTPIMSTLDRLQGKGLGDGIDRRQIDGALQSAERARILVQRLLAFARRQPLQAKAVDVGELVRGMADLVSSTAGPQIRVGVEIEPDLHSALADANQIEMALLNLAINARDAMPAGGTLRISAVNDLIGAGHGSGAAPGAYVRLSVADTGTGMDEATLKRAVEPFFSTKGVGQGTGLGLSMVHGLAAQLGGALSIHSRPGLGTNVEIRLPVASSPAEAKPAGGDTPQALQRSAGQVLLVDDEDLVRGAAAFMLGDLGFEVTEASSAEDALRLLEGGLTPDLLVTDHLMPGLSGTDLVRSLRTSRPRLPTLLVSGYADLEGVAPDLPRLTKPFRSADLARMVATVMENVGA